jgi:serine/threonine protein kinase
MMGRGHERRARSRCPRRIDRGRSAGRQPRISSRARSSLGRFLVLEPIGSGGLGVVVAAYDPQLHRKVAIKLLHPRSVATEELREHCAA